MHIVHFVWSHHVTQCVHSVSLLLILLELIEIMIVLVRFQVFAMASMTMTVFCDVVPFSHLLPLSLFHHPLPYWSSQSSTLSDIFLDLNQIPHV
jgi:hypothetical protein